MTGNELWHAFICLVPTRWSVERDIIILIREGCHNEADHMYVIFMLLNLSISTSALK